MEEMKEKESSFAKASADASGLAAEMEALRSQHAAAVERGDGLEAKMKDPTWIPKTPRSDLDDAVSPLCCSSCLLVCVFYGLTSCN